MNEKLLSTDKLVKIYKSLQNDIAYPELKIFVPTEKVSPAGYHIDTYEIVIETSRGQALIFKLDGAAISRKKLSELFDKIKATL